MARKPSAVIRADGILWLDIGATAKRLGTTRAKIIERATAGEFRFKEDIYGKPGWIAEPDVAPQRAAKLAADRQDAAAPPRPKTKRQHEAEWAGMSADNASNHPRGGASNDHHLRMTLPFPDPPIKPK